MGEPAIMQERVGRSFYIEHVVQSDHQAIYVARSGDPRIVLFGTPLELRKDLFVESTDGMVMVNAKPGQQYVSLIRRHPTRPGIVGSLRLRLRRGGDRPDSWC